MCASLTSPIHWPLPTWHLLFFFSCLCFWSKGLWHSVLILWIWHYLIPAPFFEPFFFVLIILEFLFLFVAFNFLVRKKKWVCFFFSLSLQIPMHAYSFLWFCVQISYWDLQDLTRPRALGIVSSVCSPALDALPSQRLLSLEVGVGQLSCAGQVYWEVVLPGQLVPVRDQGALLATSLITAGKMKIDLNWFLLSEMQPISQFILCFLKETTLPLLMVVSESICDCCHNRRQTRSSS